MNLKANNLTTLFSQNNNLIFIEYRLISKKGEGTFSEVLKAQSIKTGKYVAIKCMKAHFYNIDQVLQYTIHSFLHRSIT